jgi:hypothetical protein
VVLPDQITLNAFTGEAAIVSGPIAEGGSRWGSYGDVLTRQAPLAPGPGLDLSDWQHPDVGWGLLLPERDDFSAQDKAHGRDAPEPVQELLAARPDAPVLRYRPDLGAYKLARYFADGTRQDPEIGLSPFGIGKGRLPLYVLIAASPGEIPWTVQYSLNRRHYVGRLALPPEGLANYVQALLSDWQGADTDPTRPLLWSVTSDSMTRKMDLTITSQLSAALDRDPDHELNSTVIRDSHATHAALIDALRITTPSVIFTSSHGKTGTFEDPDAMRNDLGLPVDARRQTLDVDSLLETWSPAGAIWYASACCSAGSNDGTAYEGLLADWSSPYAVVRAVGALGPNVAPLPSRLLGMPGPLRAFVGHVEPTFDWTLLADGTGQFLTAPLVSAIYPNFYRRWPLGRAFDNHYRGVGDLYAKLNDARRDIDKRVPGARGRATYYRLTATDRESLVILGDPTAVIPPLPSQRAIGTG